MNEEFKKTDEHTLTVTREVPTPPKPAPVEQNYDLDYLTDHDIELKNQKLSLLNGALDSLAKKTKEIESNQNLIKKCEELGIKSKKEAEKEATNEQIVAKEEEINKV